LPGSKTTTFALILALLLACCALDKTASAKEKSSWSKIRRGRSLLDANGCLDCHSIRKEGYKDGVSLDGVGTRRTRQFLKDHLRDPEAHVNQNKSAFHGDPSIMPNPNLSEKEVRLIVDYLFTLKH
jgi:hypothetical protein